MIRDGALERKANAARRRELRAWKEEHGVDSGTKVFVMDPPAKNRQGDEAVREYLEGLGWHLNEAVEPPESLLFDLRFQRLRRRSSADREKEEDGESPRTSRNSVLQATGEALAPFQLTNHFRHSGCITTKTGLVRTLNDALFLGDGDPDEFAPRAYCMAAKDELAVFLDDFRRVAAECCLFGIQERAEEPVNKGLLEVCEAICKQHLESLDLVQRGADSNSRRTAVTDLEWEVVRAAQVLTVATRGDFASGWRGVTTNRPIELPAEPQPPEVEVEVASVDMGPEWETPGKVKKQSKASRPAESGAKSVAKSRERVAMRARCRETVTLDAERLVTIRRCLCDLREHGGRQHTLHSGASVSGGDTETLARQPNCYQGLWIVKPAKLSRGRGIRVFSILQELLEYVGLLGSTGVKTRREIQIGVRAQNSVGCFGFTSLRILSLPVSGMDWHEVHRKADDNRAAKVGHAAVGPGRELEPAGGLHVPGVLRAFRG